MHYKAVSRRNRVHQKRGCNQSNDAVFTFSLLLFFCFPTKTCAKDRPTFFPSAVASPFNRRRSCINCRDPDNRVALLGTTLSVSHTGWYLSVQPWSAPLFHPPSCRMDPEWPGFNGPPVTQRQTRCSLKRAGSGLSSPCATNRLTKRRGTASQPWKSRAPCFTVLSQSSTVLQCPGCSDQILSFPPPPPFFFLRHGGPLPKDIAPTRPNYGLKVKDCNGYTKQIRLKRHCS